MKRLFCSLVATTLIAASATAVALSAPPNLTGTWTVQQSGLNGNTTSRVKLTQSGKGLVGTSSNGTGFTGEFVSDTQINGKWHGPGGAGWLTVYASENGHSFNGTWGYNGRAANGSFAANKILPPSPITAAGTWIVRGAGNPGGFAGTMKCTQSGPTVVCHIGPYVINGKFRTTNKVRASWTGPTGTGWYAFWFNGDNNSYNGVWGKGADTTPAVGRVVGQRSLNG